jgi:polyribonucleotide nucleotidyltransferase
LTLAVLTEALAQAREGRLYILDKMAQVVSQPRPDLSVYAPRITTIKIAPSKIGALIGPGGKNIRKIIEESGAEVDVEDDGTVYISSLDVASMEAAKGMIEGITADVEVGKIYKGKVVRLHKIGAFVEIMPGKDGLVHISQLSDKHVDKVEDVVNEGDDITVKVMEVDSQGRINLTCRLDQEPGSVRPPRTGGDHSRSGGRGSRDRR